MWFDTNAPSMIVGGVDIMPGLKFGVESQKRAAEAAAKDPLNPANLYKKAQEQEAEAWAKRSDLGTSKELDDAYRVALSNLNSPVEGLLDKKAERMYARRLSNANRSATSGAEQQISAGVAAEQYSDDLINSTLAGEQANQQNRSAYYGMAGAKANRELQQYEYNVVQPWLQRLEFSQANLGNAMNLTAAKMQADAARAAASESASGGILGGLLGAVGTIGGALIGGPVGAGIGASLLSD